MFRSTFVRNASGSVIMNKDVEDLIQTFEIELHLCPEGESERERILRLLDGCSEMNRGLTALLARSRLRLVKDDEN